MRARGSFLSVLAPPDLTSPGWDGSGHNGRVTRIEIVV